MWAMFLLVERVRFVYAWVFNSLHHDVCPLVLCIHSFDVWFVSMFEARLVFLLLLMSVSLCGLSSLFCAKGLCWVCVEICFVFLCRVIVCFYVCLWFGVHSTFFVSGFDQVVVFVLSAITFLRVLARRFQCFYLVFWHFGIPFLLL